jgi:lysozyme family protein
MIDRFLAWWNQIVQRPDFDGQGIHDTKGDAGSWTSRGVTLAVYAAYRAMHGRPVTTVADLAAATLDELALVGRTMFWNVVQADHLWVGLDWMVADRAFGSGPGIAGKLLQQALGFTGRDVDGGIGPQTLKAVNAVADRDAFLTVFNQKNLDFLAGLIEFPEFGRGWDRREGVVYQDAVEAADAATANQQQGATT